MKNLMAHPSLRMEMIDFQKNDWFGPAAEKITERILKKANEGYLSLEIQKLDEITEMEELIFKRFKLKVRIFTEGIMAAIIPFYFSQNHIFLQKTIRGQELLKEQEVFRIAGEEGWVDEATATVGGVFSKYKNTLYMNYNQMKDFGSKEVVGIMMHEIGHAFYACAYTARLDRGNQIFADAMKKARAAKETERTKVLYMELKKDVKYITPEVVEGLTSTNPVVLGRSAIKLTQEVCFQQLQDGVYDRTSFEMLADNFATRFGYGLAVVSGLYSIRPPFMEFMMSAFQSMSMTVQAAMMLAETFEFFQYLQKLQNAPLIGRLFTTANYLLVSVFFMYVLVITSGESGSDYTYDHMCKRFNRIRAQMIEAAKTKMFTKADLENQIKAVEAIGQIIKGARVYRGPIDFLFNTFNPRDRRAYKSIERQQALEDLFNNEIFVQALKIQIGAE